MKLYVREGPANYRPAKPEEVIDGAAKAIRRRFRRGKTIRQPSDAFDLFKAEIGNLEHEEFVVAFLDNRHRLLAFKRLFRGTLDAASVYPREVVKEALNCNSAAVLAAHNHVSGVCEPSQADERLTRRLKAALELVDIRLLDHVIVAGTEARSLAATGLL